MTEDLQTVKSFVTHNQLSFPILVDRHQAAREFFDITELPEAVLLAENGKEFSSGKLPKIFPTARLSGPFDWSRGEVEDGIEQLLRVAE